MPLSKGPAAWVRLATFAAAILLAAPPVAQARVWAGYDLWLTHPQQKVYHETQPATLHDRITPERTSSAATIAVSAAQAEAEGRQVCIRPFGQGLTDVWLEPSSLALRTPDGTLVDEIDADAIEVFKVDYVPITKPSFGYSRKGLEPDPLIPMRLANGQRLGWRYGQDPNPAWRSVPLGTTQPFYVLIHVPEDATAGTYRGVVTLTARGYDNLRMRAKRVPVEVTVFPFSVKQRTLRTSFGVQWRWASRVNSANGGWLPPQDVVAPGSDRVAERTWFKADQMGSWLRYMAEHRVSPYTVAPAWSAGAGPDGGPNEYMVDYLSTGDATTYDGSRLAFDSVRLPEYEGRPSYVTDPFSSASAQSQAEDYYRSRAAQVAPWLSKAYAYPIDEPVGSQRSFVEKYAALIHETVPGVKFLLTCDPKRFDYKPIRGVDIYVHKLHFFYKDYNSWIAPLRKAGKQVWIYSHMGTQQDGVPMYLIDKPLVESRAQGWFAYKTRANGLLYYSVNRWSTPVKNSSTYRDPYTDPMSMYSIYNGKTLYANGDGTLVYPGYYPARGLTVQGAGPTGSLRMEALRDGLEDYEYLKLVETREGRTAAEGFLGQVIGKPATVSIAGTPTFPAYPKTPYQYQQTRNALAAELSQ